MIAQVTAVLDTNVIYPVISRDLLFWFAYYELYIPKWSRHIFDEWKEVMLRKGISENVAAQRIDKANAAFPNALVQNYANLMIQLELPDEKDKHVLAAAIQANADLIVTNNLKDFPKDYLHSFGLKAKSADAFLMDIASLYPQQAAAAFNEMVSNKRKPPLSIPEVLDQLRKIGLVQTADGLYTLL